MKTKKSETTPLRARRLGATEDRVGDRTGSGAGYDLMSGAKEDRRQKRATKTRTGRAR